MHPAWQYDELRQVGVDFENAAQVAAYDAKQGSDPEAERALIARLAIPSRAVVVDLGCGTASFARAAARHGAVVHAFDVSQAMLDYARDKARAEGLAGIEFHRAGFLRFSPGEESIDVVVYGDATAKRSILVTQALPAAVPLALVYHAHTSIVSPS